MVGGNMHYVVHCRRENYDEYVGRPSKWGNPFEIGKDGDRAAVIEKYREWITNGNGKYLLRHIHELQGKVLGCWCYPNACHGDVLHELSEGAKNTERQVQADHVGPKEELLKTWNKRVEK